MKTVKAKKVVSTAVVEVLDAENGLCDQCKTKLIPDLEETRLGWIIWKR